MNTLAAQTSGHQTVLLMEAVDALNVQPGGVYVDCTFGRGGHSREILRRLGPDGLLIGLDRDPQAVAAMAGLKDERFVGRYSAFSAWVDVVFEVLAAKGRVIDRGAGLVAGVLMDLGVSSPQIDTAERGFSFRSDGPLDMRMDNAKGETAASFLATAEQKVIEGVIREYGEERFARQIAAAIVTRRAQQPITNTRELAALVATAVRTREPGQDPATRTFQALRIHVNQELEELREGLKSVVTALHVGGRLAVISFHSLEDRIVKQMIQSGAEPRARLDPRLRHLPLPDISPVFKKIARIKPSPAEIATNARARSAVLRVAERV